MTHHLTPLFTYACAGLSGGYVQWRAPGTEHEGVYKVAAWSRTLETPTPSDTTVWHEIEYPLVAYNMTNMGGKRGGGAILILGRTVVRTQS